MARLDISAVLWVIIVMLSGISAVTSECAIYPPVDDPLVPLISCKVVIVGGGPGGILASWLLRALGQDVCVVEKADVFNGKIQDIPFSPGNGKPPKVFSQCAQRVNEAQLDIRCIVNELNITLQEQEFEDVIYSRAKLARSSQNFLGPNGAFPRVGAYPNSSITDFETAIYEFALVVSTDIHPVTGKKVSPHPATKCGKYATVEQYLLDIFGSEVTKWLLAMYSFRADLVSPVDVCQYIEFFKVDWERCCTNFYPVGGWSAILNKIRSQSTYSGVRFFKSSEITCLYKSLNGKYIATMSNGKGWIGDRLMFNGGPIDAVKLGGNIGSLLALSDYINAIKPIEVVTYNAFWPNRFWEAYASKAFHNFRYTTDGRCITRSEYPGHPYVLDVNASRPVYVDDPRCVDEYKALFDYGGIQAVRAQVVSDLKKMFPGVEIPQPTFDFYHLAQSAWHYMKPWSTAKNITIASIFDWALKPLGDPRFCLVGEPYALGGSGWVHGAYLSAVNCIENNMLDLLPKVKADLVKAKIKYYASGCNGMPTPFSNEIMSIKGVTLPGANLALEGEQNQVAARRLAVTVRTRKEQRERFRI